MRALIEKALLLLIFGVAQLLSYVQSFVMPWSSTPGFLVLLYLPDFAQTHVHWVSDTFQPSHPLSSPLLLPSIFPDIRVFSNDLALRTRWPKYWSFRISPSNEYSGLISFRIDWFDLLAVSKGLSRVFSSTSVWKHQFFCTQPSLWSSLSSVHDCWKTHSFDYTDICQQSNVSAF